MKILLVTLAVVLSIVRSEAYKMDGAFDMFSMPDALPNPWKDDSSEEMEAKGDIQIKFHSFDPSQPETAELLALLRGIVDVSFGEWNAFVEEVNRVAQMDKGKKSPLQLYRTALLFSNKTLVAWVLGTLYAHDYLKDAKEVRWRYHVSLC